MNTGRFPRRFHIDILNFQMICSRSRSDKDSSRIVEQRTFRMKRGSRNAARAAKALRWRVDRLLKCLIKEITLFS